MKTVLPVICGIFAVLTLLFVYNIILTKDISYNNSDLRFYLYFLPAALIILIVIQITLLLPCWEVFKLKKKILGFGIIPFTFFLTFVSGLIFGVLFWETSAGIIEFLLLTLTGIVSFAVYWSVNLITIKQLDKN
jgi:hypothetical protein